MANFYTPTTTKKTAASSAGSSSSGRATSGWTDVIKDAITAYDPTYNDKAAPWERGKYVEDYYNVPGVLDAVYDSEKQRALEWARALREVQLGANQGMIDQQLAANPLFFQQQIDLINAAYPESAAIRENLASDVMGRLTGDTTQAYPIPESITNLFREQSINAANARGLPVSGASAMAESKGLAEIGANLRTQDVNTALSLLGMLPATSTTSSQAAQVVSPINLSGIMGSTLSNQQAKERQMLGYNLANRQAQDASSSSWGGLLGSTLGTLLGTTAGGLGSTLGNLFNSGSSNSSSGSSNYLGVSPFTISSLYSAGGY